MTTTPRKIIRSSHLALRFYKSDGWTREMLEPYLVTGGITDRFPKDEKTRDYYIMEQGAEMDTDRLATDHNPRVFDWHNKELEGAEALAYLKEMNW